MKERFLNSADEPSVDIASAERPFSFDGDDAAFQLACEAKRIDLAFLLATRTRLPKCPNRSLQHSRLRRFTQVRSPASSSALIASATVEGAQPARSAIFS